MTPPAEAARKRPRQAAGSRGAAGVRRACGGRPGPRWPRVRRALASVASAPCPGASATSSAGRQASGRAVADGGPALVVPVPLFAAPVAARRRSDRGGRCPRVVPRGRPRCPRLHRRTASPWVRCLNTLLARNPPSAVVPWCPRPWSRWLGLDPAGEAANADAAGSAVGCCSCLRRCHGRVAHGRLPVDVFLRRRRVPVSGSVGTTSPVQPGWQRGFGNLILKQVRGCRGRMPR